MDWKDLQSLTADSLRIYEALRRAERLSEEGERLLREAEDLLRRAALAYLLEPLSPEYLPTPKALLIEAMADAWVQIEQAWADLKDALYRLAKSNVEEKWDTARPILSALLEIEPGYRDCGALLTDTYLREARARFSQERWNEGRVLLTNATTISNVDKKLCKLEILNSFIDEAQRNLFWLDENVLANSYFELMATCEPKVRDSPAFTRARDAYWRLEHALRCRDQYQYSDNRYEYWDKQVYSAQPAWEQASAHLKSVLSALVFGEESH